MRLVCAAALLCLIGCRGSASDLPDAGGPPDSGEPRDAGGDAGAPDAGAPADAGQGRAFFDAHVVPVLEAKCAGCHTGGERFGFAALGTDLDAGYQKFVDQLSIDAPAQSRLLTKAIDDAPHAGGAVLTPAAPEYQTVLDWA